MHSMLGSHDCTHCILSSVMEEEQGYAMMVDAASCHAAPALLQLGQGNEKKISIDKQHDEQ